MSEMVEKVARAIFASDWPKDDWNRLGNGGYHQTRYSNMARAAIEAIRVPTPQMLAAGWVEITKAKKAVGIARLGPGPGLSDGYSAMISAALKEE